MSIKKDRPIIQDSESFAELLQKLVRSTKIKHFCNKAIGNFKNTNPFKTLVSVTGMFNMHDGSGWIKDTTVEKFCIPQDGSESTHKHREEQTQTLR